MLGRIYTSVEHLLVPSLVHLEQREVLVKAGTKGVSYNLYRLDWDSVDDYKRHYYVKWIEEHWQEKFPVALANRFPETLPERYNQTIKDLTFALSHDYLTEIRHFGLVYFMERQRVRHFDTVIREMCLQVAQSSINCAFKLLADCIYDQQQQSWFRSEGEINKSVASCLLRYKFWREATGRGLVWDHAGLDDLERAAAYLDLNPQLGNKEQASLYQRCLEEVRRWEGDQEVFWNFISVPADPQQAEVDTDAVELG